MKDTSGHLCICGTPFRLEADSAPVGEFTCSCGRMYECDLSGDEAGRISEPITPEPRQPLAGFSRELQQQEDIRRYYFKQPARLGNRLPVHVLFSPSSREAELKTGDIKPLHLSAVSSVFDARRRWINWFESVQPPPKGGARRRLQASIS